MPVALLTIHIEFECLKELDLFTFEVCNMSSLSSNCSIFMILNGNHIGFWQTNLEWEMLYASGSSKDTSKKPLLVQLRLHTCKQFARINEESSNWKIISTQNVTAATIPSNYVNEMNSGSTMLFSYVPHWNTDFESLPTKKLFHPHIMHIVDTINIRLDFTNSPLLCIAHRIGCSGYGVFVYICTSYLSASVIYLNHIVIVCGWNIVSFIHAMLPYSQFSNVYMFSTPNSIANFLYTPQFGLGRGCQKVLQIYSLDILVEFGMHPNKWKRHEWLHFSQCLNIACGRAK